MASQSELGEQPDFPVPSSSPPLNIDWSTMQWATEGAQFSALNMSPETNFQSGPSLSDPPLDIEGNKQQWAAEGIEFPGINTSPAPLIATLPHAGVNLNEFDFRASLRADSATNETPGGSTYFQIGYHLDHDGFVHELFVGFSKFIYYILDFQIFYIEC